MVRCSFTAKRNLVDEILPPSLFDDPLLFSSPPLIGLFPDLPCKDSFSSIAASSLPPLDEAGSLSFRREWLSDSADSTSEPID